MRTSSTTCSTTSPTATPDRCSTSWARRRSARRARGSASWTCSRARRRSANRRATTGAGRTNRRRSTSRCAKTGSRSGRPSSATRSPLRFVCSTRLSSFDGDARSSTEQIRNRLARYPDLEFKLDPENDWDAALIDEIAALAAVLVLDLKGMYSGTPVDVDTDPELYRAVAEKFPDAYLEDPDINDETGEVLAPHDDRITWDAPLQSLADIKERARKAINSKPSRFGSLEELLSVYEYCDANGIAIYGGGQGELMCGRGQIQYLASLFHPDTPNDVAPSGYNDPAVPKGMPTSPMDPSQSETGFRWAE